MLFFANRAIFSTSSSWHTNHHGKINISKGCTYLTIISTLLMNLGFTNATFFKCGRRPVRTGTSSRSQGLVLVDFSSTTFIRVSCAGFPRIGCDDFADFRLTASANHFLRQHVKNEGYKRELMGAPANC